MKSETQHDVNRTTLDNNCIYCPDCNHLARLLLLDTFITTFSSLGSLTDITVVFQANVLRAVEA